MSYYSSLPGQSLQAADPSENKQKSFCKRVDKVKTLCHTILRCQAKALVTNGANEKYSELFFQTP